MSAAKYWFYYLTDDDVVIRVAAKRKPVQRRRSYVVYEPQENGKFGMACFPEISATMLNVLTYIGKSKLVSNKGE